MTALACVLVLTPVVLAAYSSVVYPAALWLMSRGRRRDGRSAEPAPPMITITVPAYNEEKSIAETLTRLLEMDYPSHLRQVLVISDASTDNTDEIVKTFADRGVELVRLPARRGKTAAENLAATHARGEIVVNIDASVRVGRSALRPLVRAFADPRVGVASGRDISEGAADLESNSGEAGYVGFEMWLRGLETDIHSIIGASGCFFATRKSLYVRDFPESLSRDFASALIARENGYLAVSVEEAVCVVPRTRSLRAEFGRKVRTMARGLATLEYKRHLLDPERYGLFAWMLISHKLTRWLVYAALPFALLGLVMLSTRSVPARVALLGVCSAGLLGALALWWPEGRRMPRWLSALGYLFVSNLAGVIAWWKYLAGERQAMWEPTRRSGD